MSEQIFLRQAPAAGQADVWIFSLDASLDAWPDGTGLLSAEEQRRLARFRFERHRRRFAVRRFVLRHVLSTYLDVSPERITYEVDDFGKPTVVSNERRQGFGFSTSHTEDLGVVMVASSPRCGIDIEHLDHAKDVEAVAERMFGREEADEVLEAVPADRATVFLNCWTAKEAYLKALGFGLSKPLDSFRVAAACDQPARLIWDRTSADDPSDWRLHRVGDVGDCVLTVALHGPLTSIRLLEPPARWPQTPRLLRTVECP